MASLFFMSFSLGDTLTPHALMADKDPPSLTSPEDYTLVSASRVIEQAGMSSLRWIERSMGSMPAVCFSLPPFLLLDEK